MKEKVTMGVFYVMYCASVCRDCGSYVSDMRYCRILRRRKMHPGTECEVRV